MPKDFNAQVQGTVDAWYTQSLLFEVLKCDRTIPAHNCAEPGEIDKFIGRIDPEIWINSE